MNNKTHEIDNPVDSDEINSNEQPASDEDNPSITPSVFNKHVNIDSQNTNTLASLASIKKSYSQKEKSGNDNNTDQDDNLPAKTTINRKNGQQVSHILATDGYIQSSISIVSSSKPKQRLVSKEREQTVKLLSYDQHPKLDKNHNTGLNNSSQSKKRKLNDNEKRIQIYSSVKHQKRRSEQEVNCSAIIPRVEYDSRFDAFNGFVTPIIDGTPLENAFKFTTFNDLETAIETVPRANVVNVHLVQPISNSNTTKTPPATVLSAYGTNNRINAMDVLKRWLFIYQEFHSRGIRILGYSTDGDPKYLRGMRLASNFFLKKKTLNIFNDKLLFKVEIPSNWSFWYFLEPTQLFVFIQDGVHLCTKVRNRLLSKRAKLKMGLYDVSIKHLYHLIKTTNKIDHNLSRSLKVVNLNAFSSGVPSI
ncbi:unnamed protein product, partial [Rotaria sp. Silwood2]